MSTVTKAISSVEFHVNARQANAALQSIQEEAKRCRLQVEELQEQAAKGVTTVKVDGMDVDIQKRIKEVKALQKTWESAAQSQIKGAKAFDELWKNARMGTIESMTGAQIKSGINASKPIYDRLRLGDAEDRMKAQAIKDMQDQGQKVLNQLKTTTDQIIKQIADGENIAADVLEREARNLKSIMDLLPPLSQEWKDYNLQYQAINQQIERQTVLERQLRGEIVTRKDAINVVSAANREATQQEIAQEEQRAKTAREAAEAKAAEADQYRTTVEQKQSEIFATNDLIAAKRREIDAHHESAAAAKDAADKARDAAYKDRKQAEQDARNQQDAYNKQKKIRDDAAKDVEKYRKELEKLREVKAEPKVDIGGIKSQGASVDELKQKLKDTEAELAKVRKEWGNLTSQIQDEGMRSPEWSGDAKALSERKSRLERQIKNGKDYLTDWEPGAKYNASAVEAEQKRLIQHYTELIQKQEESIRLRKEALIEAGKAARLKDVELDFLKAEQNVLSFFDKVKSEAVEMQAKFKEVDISSIIGSKTPGEVLKNLMETRKEMEKKGFSDESNGMYEWIDKQLYKLEELRRSYTETGNAARGLKKHSKKWTEEIETPDSELQDSRQQLLNAERALEKVKEVETAEKELLEVEKKLKDAQSPDAQAKEKEAMEQRMIELKKKDAEYSQRCNELNQQCDDLNRQIAESTKQSTTATAASNEQDEKRAGVQQKLADAETRLADENRKLNEQADKTITANQQAAQAANTHQQSVKALGDVMEENRKTGQRLGEEMGQLTKQHKQQTEELAEASEKMTDAEKESNRHIKTEQEARLRIQQLNNQSIEQLTASLRVLEEENRRINDPGNQQWQENERYIGQLNLRLEELKKQSAELRREPVLDMMTQRMQSLGTLSRDALQETKKFWETMVAGAEKGSGELADYEQHLKSIALEEQARVREQGREAFAFFQREDYRRTNAADTEEQRKALVAYRDALPADATDHIEAINALLEKHAQFVKEAAGEWMSLEKAMELASKAGTDGFAGSAKDIQLATQSLERQRDTIIATIREKRNLGQATKAEEDQLADLTKKLRSLKFEQDNVNMSQEKMRTLIETPANAVNLDELRAAIKRADGQLRQMEQSLGQNSSEYKRFAEQVRQAKNVMKEMEGQAKASATAWEKAFNRLKTYVVMYMGFNELWQKITGTMGDMLELSDKMGEVMKTTGFTADQVARLSDNLKDLDTRTPMVKLMELSSIAGSIGLKTQQQVEGFTDAANQLMVALPEMGTEAARTLMKIADATGDLEKNNNDVRETLERVGSTIIALRANSAAAAGPITDFVSRVGAVGAQAGISIDQIAALGATVDALGGRVEMSATALSRMIPAIRNNSFAVANAIGMTEKELKGMTAMEQMVAIFKALRDSVKQFDTSTDEGMNAMADKVEQMLGNSASMQEVMKTLNQQGARAGIVFGLLSQNVDKLEEQLTTATGAYEKNTALMEEYNKMNDTAAARWERLKNQLEEFFVTAGNTSWLSETIDLLRKLIVLITEEGPIGSFFRWTLVYLGMVQAGWSKAIGTALISLYQFTAATFKSTTATAADTAAKAANAAAANAQATATGKAAAAQGLLNKTMKANLITAVVTAVVALGFRLWEYFRAANSAQEAQKRLNEAVSQATVEAEREVGHLNNVIKALDNAKMSAEGRKEVIDKFNRDYSKYIDALGIEIKTVQDLKDNYDLLTSAIRRAAFERVRDQFKAQELEPLIKEAVEQGADLQTGANSTLNAIVLNDAQKSVSQFTKAVADLTEKNLKDFRSTYRKQLQALGLDAEKATLSQIQTAATPKASNRLVNQAIQQGPQSLNEYLIGKMDRGEIKDAAEAYKDIIKKEFSKGELFNAVFDENLNYVIGQRVVNGRTVGTPLTEPTGAPGGEKSSAFNEKLYEQIEKFVTAYMEVKNRNDQIDAAFRPYVGSEDIASGNGGGGSNGGGGGGGTNPYGDYNKVTSPYKDWNGNDLVARRKEMLERVKALANGADVQAVLSEDAKFISDAVRKNIKTTEQAIEWYNTERLKIQEALHGKHLTNTGDWQDPEKVRKRAGRVVQDEMKYYLDELDAYYTERKTRIEQARNDEEITEGEAWRRTIQNDNEWQTRRAELQLLYSRRAAKVTEDEMQAIFDIISERTGETVNYIKADIAQTNKFIVDVGKKSKAAMDRIYGDIELGAEKSYLKAAQAIGKQMKFIEDTLAKERPYDGITKNLQDNLDKMGVLAAKYRRENDELARQGKEPKYSNEQITAQSYDEMAFYLRQAADAYSIDIDELLRRMVKEGMTATAEEISKSDMLKQAVMGQLRKTYQEVQDAIKKEASQIKKDVEIIWNDDARGIGGMSMKATFDKALAQLGMQQDSVSRANSLIGAGAASDNVASRLAMKQIEVQMRMQKAQYDMYRVQANQRMAALRAEAKEHQRIAELEKQAGHEAAAAEQRTKAMVALRDAENVRLSLGLTLAEETKKEEQQKAELLKIQEESQNRLYTSLREWADLLTSSLQGVMEASHAGDAEYYNERAKLDLTGKGGPGAGTYVVIDDAGTSDAKAHYEYLDEREALERQHEIEIQNAQAEAWRKLMDDLNMKMSEQITDWMNAALQQQAVAENTAALKLNTDAEQRHLEVVSDENGIVEYNTDAVRSNTSALQGLTQQLAQGITIRPATDGSTGSQQGGTTAAPAAATPATGTTTPVSTETTTEGSSDSVVFLPGVTPGVSWTLTEEQMAAEQEQLDQRVEMQREAAEKVRIANEAAFHSSAKTEKDTGNQMAKSNASTFAKMTMSANLYGIAYQAMSNDNLSATQKFEMIALQSVGNFAISSLTAFMSKAVAEGAVNEATVLGKLWSQLGWAAAPVFAIFTGLLGAAMGAATSAVSKSKSQIAQATGSSVGAGRLATGMQTYAEGNVNELTDPASLTPGRQYNVDGADGKTYRARYMGKGAKTHITNGPEFHLVGEAGREAIIDAKTTRLLQMNETGIWRDIQTLYNGGSISGLSTRRRRGGVRAYAEGNVGEFEDALGGEAPSTGTGGMEMEQMLTALDRNSAIQEALLERLNQPIYAQNILYGPDGLPNIINKLNKEAQRHGEKYL